MRKSHIFGAQVVGQQQQSAGGIVTTKSIATDISALNNDRVDKLLQEIPNVSDIFIICCIPSHIGILLHVYISYSYLSLTKISHSSSHP